MKKMRAKQMEQILEEQLPGGSGASSRPETKTITVGAIMAALPEEVQREILHLVNTVEDDMDLSRQLKDLLRPHAPALDKIGLLADYTAYALVYVRNQASRPAGA